jgi:hypothetical protein
MTEASVFGLIGDAALLNGAAMRHIPAVLDHTMIDPRSDTEWSRLVGEHPEATIFHTSAWANVLCDTYGHVPRYLRFTMDDKLHALLPLMEVASPLTGRRGVSLPFSDFCAPLVFAESPSNHRIVETLAHLARERRWKYFELRSTPTTTSAIVPNKTFYTHKLDLRKPMEQLLEGLDSAARRAIRKAERSGLTVEVSRDEKAVEQFYRLHGRTRRRHGVPPQPWRFFSNIFKHIINQDLGFVVLARRHARPVAAAADRAQELRHLQRAETRRPDQDARRAQGRRSAGRGRSRRRRTARRHAGSAAGSAGCAREVR